MPRSVRNTASDSPFRRISTQRTSCPIQVAVLDAWGNATCPTPDLPYTLELSSAVLQPQPALLEADARGCATVQGVRVAAPGPEAIGTRQVGRREAQLCEENGNRRLPTANEPAASSGFWNELSCEHLY